ncbi:MAG: YdjY domain-containing protein [Tepidisphaeraceae bacterium]
MKTMRRLSGAVVLLGLACWSAVSAAPATQPVQLPHVQVDVEHKRVRIECQAIMVEQPLEFFCVVRNGPEHETVLRTDAKPSHIHAALLMLGLQPGSPATYDEAKKEWHAPHGPAVKVSVEFKKSDGTLVTLPAEQLMRDIKTHKPMPQGQWIFAGSKQREDGVYLADLAGYVVSIVNFELSLIDVPKVVSSSNATLEWQCNPDVGLKLGDPVTMILEPGATSTTAPATQP